MWAWAFSKVQTFLVRLAPDERRLYPLAFDRQPICFGLQLVGQGKYVPDDRTCNYVRNEQKFGLAG